MPTIKLTEKSVAKLKAPDPSGNQVIYLDSHLRGFGVRVSGKSNDKSYIVQGVVDDKSRRVTIGPCNVLTLVEARARAQGYLGDFARGVDPKAKKAAGSTLRQALDAYLKARKDLRASSAAVYRTAVEGHLSAWLDQPLSNITRDDVEARHRAIADEMQARHVADGNRLAAQWTKRAEAAAAKGLMDAAANHRARAAMALSRKLQKGHAAADTAMRSLQTVWNHVAERNEELGANPVRLKRMWYGTKPRERMVKSDELPAFYKAVTELKSAVGRDYILMLLFTGMRRREAASLRWSDVDLQARVIRVPAARTKSGRKLDLPMTDVVHDMLVARRAIGSTGEFVFFAAGKSGHLEETKWLFNDIAKASGVRISAHDLRRTFLTIAESCDISPIALRGLVNHSLGKDVTSGYIQMNAERLRGPAQRVADRIKMLCDAEPPTAENVTRLQA
jgi:integrase